MLIKVTNYCSMGCSHCMEDSTVAGKHMTDDTFEKALEQTIRLEHQAWSAGAPPFVLLSGGEPTEHPNILHFIKRVFDERMYPMLITNGSWLSNKELRESILKPEWEDLFIQVTNDKRFYPKQIEEISDPRISYVDSLTMMLPLGRYKGKTSDLPTRKGPSSFNLRSATIQFKDIRKAIALLRIKSALGSSGQCIPNITSDGDIMAGETRNCFKIGTVHSTHEELTKALIEMRCNKCGLEDNLTPAQKRAINASVLFAPGE